MYDSMVLKQQEFERLEVDITELRNGQSALDGNISEIEGEKQKAEEVDTRIKRTLPSYARVSYGHSHILLEGTHQYCCHIDVCRIVLRVKIG